MFKCLCDLCEFEFRLSKWKNTNLLTLIILICQSILKMHQMFNDLICITFSLSECAMKILAVLFLIP